MRLRRDRRGNVAIITGLLALPLMGLVGLAIDFGAASAAKAQLDLAADAAALVGTTNASNAFIAKAADPIGPAKTAAVQRFRGQANSKVNLTLTSVTATITQSGTTLVSDVSYTATVPMTLGQLFGVTTANLSGHSTATISLNPYIDIQVLMDVSSSMTLAATEPEMRRLETLLEARGQKCSLACHYDSSGSDYYDYSQQQNVLLRINVLRNAVAHLVSTVNNLKVNTAVRLALYTFGQAFAQIYPLSTNVSGASAALAKIAPDVNGCQSDLSCADTFFSQAMASIDSITSTSGDGTSQAKSQKFLFIVSDGLVDQVTNGNTREYTTLGKYDCDRIKAKGVTVLTLYTPYLPIPPGNYSYDNFVAPIQDRIGPGMRDCASAPNLYFQADNAADVDAKLHQMLAAAVQISGHFTR